MQPQRMPTENRRRVREISVDRVERSFPVLPQRDERVAPDRAKAENRKAVVRPEVQESERGPFLVADRKSVV